MRLTLIHPAIGHRADESYIRTWQMESLPIAVLTGLTPKDIDLRFYDDRMETIPFDEPTDAVAIPLETYTARRAYQIASEYRARGIPVIMGGFHATLAAEEAARFADVVVTGEAEGIWHTVMDDLKHGTLQARYEGIQKPLSEIRVDRRLFRDKKYLPIGLVETGRGCRFPCEFCAIQSFFSRTHRTRPVEDVITEMTSLQHERKLFFFVDDNFAGNIHAAKELLRELAKLRLRWITQMSINAAHDEEFLDLLSKSGCRGVLIGFESLNPDNLKQMKKGFNSMKGGFTQALSNLRKYNLRVYGTFVFGYDHDNENSFNTAVDFAIEQKMYIAAFNHLTPFPGTPLYQRLQSEGRLLYDSWWTDPDYRYNTLPFSPHGLPPEAITAGCIAARKKFYSWQSIARRSTGNWEDWFMFKHYLPINAMHHFDISKRDGYPLGDETWQGQYIETGK